MQPETLVLAFDTSAAHCAAALLSFPRSPGQGRDQGQNANRLLGARHEAMSRGQAERLFGLIEALLTDCGVGWPDIDVIGVGIGPGNFTGVRISVSAARGLALGLGIPAIGVDGFEAAGFRRPRPLHVAVPAPRNQVHLRQLDVGHHRPSLVDAADLPRLAGPIAHLTDLSPSDHVANIAKIAALKSLSPQPRPAPLYIRAADAAPASDAPPTILP